MSLIPETFERDVLRALQLSYYVDNISLMSDYDFDMVEAEYTKQSGQALPVGSDLIDSYTEAQRALALYLQFSHSKRGKKDA